MKVNISMIHKQSNRDQRKLFAKHQPIHSLKQHEFLRRLKENGLKESVSLKSTTHFWRQNQKVKMRTKKSSKQTKKFKTKQATTLWTYHWGQSTLKRSLQTSPLSAYKTCSREGFSKQTSGPLNGSFRNYDSASVFDY